MLIENPKRRPPFITFVGEPGTGKTSLSCMFPDSIIIRLEDGIEAVPERFMPSVMGKVETSEQLEEQIRWVFAARKQHGKKTLILDSITRAETMFEREIVANDPNRPSSINQACGGFGAGPKALGGWHARFRKLLGHLNEKGDMTVIVIAHSSVETVEPPDGDNYTRHTLRLGKHSMAPWVDDVDMVGFIQLQRYVKGAKEGDKKGLGAKAGKAMSDGTRVIVFGPRAGNVSKNRFGLEIKVGDDYLELPDPNKPDSVNVLLPLIPYYVENGMVSAPVEVEKKAEKVVDDAPELEETSTASQQGPSDEMDDEPEL